MKKEKASITEGFSKFNRKERIEKLIQIGVINQHDAQHLNSTQKLPFSFAENLIENFIGYFQIPLGVAVGFCIDGQDYIIPMAIEETSVIAAASKTAKWLKHSGVIQTKNCGYLAIGQIQIARVKNFNQCKKQLLKYKEELIHQANIHIAARMTKRGGGVKDMSIRKIQRDDGFDMVVIHIFIATCDAMGANIINQICEFLKTPIEKCTNEKVNLCILSNLTDTKLTQANIVVNEIESTLGAAIAEASLFAQLDPYRAATHNKGVLNAIDAVAIATGNDWRALEAGIHAYAARKGRYQPITSWQVKNGKLHGEFVAPINIGTVGGVTRLHPTASLCLKILNIDKAEQLARILAAVGLVQNLAALIALSSEGIVRGHMRLHFNNLCLSAGATDQEIKALKKYFNINETNQHITTQKIKKILSQIRNQTLYHED